MNIISELFNNRYSVMIISLVLLLSIIWNIILSIRFSKLESKYKKFMRGSKGKNLENILLDYYKHIKEISKDYNEDKEELTRLKEKVDKSIQKHSIVRYSAFDDTGSDLSYSLAFLDNYNNGVILTGIYGRNETITYAKPIYNCESNYPLSVEEQLVIDRCVKKQNR